MISTRQYNLKDLIEFGYCIGCGLCVGLCKNDATKMITNQFGLFEPHLPSDCLNCEECNYVCPFGSGILNQSNTLDEDKIFEQISGTSNCTYHDLLGYYRKCYIGYSPEYRLTSSSGGIATWILTYLLKNNIIDNVICVKPYIESDNLFEYKICSNVDEVNSASKSHYYPVHLANVIKQVLAENKRYAIVGLPCFIKGIRLAQIKNIILKERIIFSVGLFCGGMKSHFFTEYLAARLGIEQNKFKYPIYRIKHEGPTSQGYYFGCIDQDTPGRIIEQNVKKLGDLWGPGYFKAKACDYCDDVTAEVADISLGDAWINPYQQDWKGHSIIIVRTEAADRIITDGIRKNELVLENIATQKIVKSQMANFIQRRTGLSYRLYWNRNTITPIKRVPPKKPENLIVSAIFYVKTIIREKSLVIWHQLSPSKTKLVKFNIRLLPYITMLKMLYFVDKKFILRKK